MNIVFEDAGGPVNKTECDRNSNRFHAMRLGLLKRLGLRFMRLQILLLARTFLLISLSSGSSYEILNQ